MARLRIAVLLSICCLAVSAAGLAPAARGQTASMCARPATGGVPAVQHVLVVMMENASYGSVLGHAGSTPYQNNVLAAQCGVGDQMFGVTHTSAANYLALTGGRFPPGSPAGCGSVSACATGSPSLFSQLDSARLPWTSYEESMPTACAKHGSGLYTLGHNPAVFYSTLSSCPARDVAVADLSARSGPMWADLQQQTLPAFAFVTPNVVDDAHSGLAGGDEFLSRFIPMVTSSPSYQSGNTVLLVTYDEGVGSDARTGQDCTNRAADLAGQQKSCHIPFFVVYPFSGPRHDATFFDHYSVTRTVEQRFRLPYLSHAGDGQTTSLLGHFGLPAP